MITNSNPPKDSYNISLCASFFLGLAFMVPWNFFVTAEEYWKYKFRDDDATYGDTAGRSNENQKFFISYLGSVCNGIFLAALFLNTIFTMKFNNVTRITGSLFGVTSLMALTTALVMVNTDSWLVAIEAGSAAGVCGFLPERYMGANSLGQSVCGAICALIQIGCLMLGFSPQRTALIFFGIAVIILMMTSTLWRMMRSMEFFQHYRLIASCRGNDSEMDRDRTLKASSQVFRFWHIFLQGWEFHLSALLTGMLTMPIFPGLGYMGSSTHAEESPFLKKFFLPVLCFFTYSIADVAGRYSEAFISYNPSRRKLLVTLSCSRFVLVPLLLICNLAPSGRSLSQVLIRSDAVFTLIMFLTGFSNGYLLNAAFKNGPKSVPLEDQETSATIVMCSFGSGATLGSGLLILVLKLL